MNKSIKYLIIFVTLVMLLIPSTAFARELFDDRVVAGGTFRLESGETLDGSLIIFGGTATTEADSVVEGDVVVLGGIVSVNGYVEGNLVGVGGVVNLNENAIVDGDLTTVAATLNRNPGAQVNGQVITGIDIPALSVLPSTIDIPSFTRFEPAISPAAFTFWRIFWFIFRTILWGALAALVTMFLPNQTTKVSDAIIDQPLTTGGVGLLAVIVVPIILVLLAITCILSPVSLLGALAIVIAWAFGRIAIGLEIGRRIAKSFDKDWPVPLAAGVGTFGLALVVDSAGTFIDCVGWLLPTVVGLFGLGGVILTRFGTSSYPPDQGAGSIDDTIVPAELIEADETEVVEGEIAVTDEPDDIPDPGGES
jgi:hypothetical protein